MRTIKFRAWDGIKMLQWDEIKNQFYDVMAVANFTVMQFTGLLDKNGVEIYEGDIVKFRSHPDKQIFGLVEYFPNECRFCVLYYRDDFDKERKQISYYSFLHYNTLESIGNIYQNPNLIK